MAAGPGHGAARQELLRSGGPRNTSTGCPIQYGGHISLLSDWSQVARGSHCIHHIRPACKYRQHPDCGNHVLMLTAEITSAKRSYVQPRISLRWRQMQMAYILCMPNVTAADAQFRAYSNVGLLPVGQLTDAPTFQLVETRGIDVGRAVQQSTYHDVGAACCTESVQVS